MYTISISLKDQLPTQAFSPEFLAEITNRVGACSPAVSSVANDLPAGDPSSQTPRDDLQTLTPVEPITASLNDEILTFSWTSEPSIEEQNKFIETMFFLLFDYGLHETEVTPVIPGITDEDNRLKLKNQWSILQQKPPTPHNIAPVSGKENIKQALNDTSKTHIIIDGLNLNTYFEDIKGALHDSTIAAYEFINLPASLWLHKLIAEILSQNMHVTHCSGLNEVNTATLNEAIKNRASIKEPMDAAILLVNTKNDIINALKDPKNISLKIDLTALKTGDVSTIARELVTNATKVEHIEFIGLDEAKAKAFVNGLNDTKYTLGETLDKLRLREDFNKATGSSLLRKEHTIDQVMDIIGQNMALQPFRKELICNTIIKSLKPNYAVSSIIGFDESLSEYANQVTSWVASKRVTPRVDTAKKTADNEVVLTDIHRILDKLNLETRLSVVTEKPAETDTFEHSHYILVQKNCTFSVIEEPLDIIAFKPKSDQEYIYTKDKLYYYDKNSTVQFGEINLTQDAKTALDKMATSEANPLSPEQLNEIASFTKHTPPTELFYYNIETASIEKIPINNTSTLINLKKTLLGTNLQEALPKTTLEAITQITGHTPGNILRINVSAMSNDDVEKIGPALARNTTIGELVIEGLKTGTHKKGIDNIVAEINKDNKTLTSISQLTMQTYAKATLSTNAMMINKAKTEALKNDPQKLTMTILPESDTDSAIGEKHDIHTQTNPDSEIEELKKQLAEKDKIIEDLANKYALLSEQINTLRMNQGVGNPDVALQNRLKKGQEQVIDLELKVATMNVALQENHAGASDSATMHLKHDEQSQPINRQRAGKTDTLIATPHALHQAHKTPTSVSKGTTSNNRTDIPSVSNTANDLNASRSSPKSAQDAHKKWKHIYGAAPEKEASRVALTINYKHELTPEDHKELETGLVVELPSKHKYTLLKLEGEIPRAVLKADDIDKDSSNHELAILMINMIDNILANGDVVNVNTEDPFLAEIARQYITLLEEAEHTFSAHQNESAPEITSSIETEKAAAVFADIRGSLAVEQLPWFNKREQSLMDVELQGPNSTYH